MPRDRRRLGADVGQLRPAHERERLASSLQLRRCQEFIAAREERATAWSTTSASLDRACAFLDGVASLQLERTPLLGSFAREGSPLDHAPL
jgi:hypothetical protein